MQSLVLTSSNLSDNESSLCHYRSVQRVRTARALAKSGHIVYAGLWAPDGNIRPSEESAQAFELNILSESSVSAAIHAAMKAPEGRLDTPIHNAGHVAYGPAEAFTTRQFMDFFNRLCRHAAHQQDSPATHAQGRPGIVRIDFVKFRPWAKCTLSRTLLRSEGGNGLLCPDIRRRVDSLGY